MLRLNQKAAETKAAETNKKIKQSHVPGQTTATAPTAAAGKKDDKKSVKGQAKGVTLCFSPVCSLCSWRWLIVWLIVLIVWFQATELELELVRHRVSYVKSVGIFHSHLCLRVRVLCWAGRSRSREQGRGTGNQNTNSQTNSNREESKEGVLR